MSDDESGHGLEEDVDASLSQSEVIVLVDVPVRFHF
jgi:hypothetical protein